MTLRTDPQQGEIKRSISSEGDGGLQSSMWDTFRRYVDGRDFHWKGRACKVYSKVGDEWKMTMHTGLPDYGPGTCSD
ncbi:MAG: hypothetical protein IPG76_05140 [Acidobacteria bacterium]|nr:hypothetical protein [Acidobacteriota bacterium]